MVKTFTRWLFITSSRRITRY